MDDPTSAMIDWDLAVSTAGRLVRPGPPVSYGEAADVVGQLRTLAVEAEQHVAAVTGLAIGDVAPPVAVVDRMAWVRGNVEGFRVVMAPVVRALSARNSGGPGSGMTQAVGRRVTGVQVGSLLAFLSGRVLGQYEIFLPPQAGIEVPGRLSLVAPNIVMVERAMRVDARDFRLWVCLHEQTHRVQFTAVPWLKGHVEGLVGELVSDGDLDPSALLARLRSAGTGLVDVLRGEGELSLLELVQSPRQREVLDRVQAFMSLIEGHADYVMDAAGPQVIASLPTIRRRFDRRRQGLGPVDKVVRRLLGMDLKMRQYADGSRFVRGVVDQVGMAGFNTVWTSAETLPTRAEIDDAQGPAAWVARVHGSRALGAR